LVTGAGVGNLNPPEPNRLPPVVEVLPKRLPPDEKLGPPKRLVVGFYYSSFSAFSGLGPSLEALI
jgi:hypothetical protein